MGEFAWCLLTATTTCNETTFDAHLNVTYQIKFVSIII